jgi:hypothetical protein
MNLFDKFPRFDIAQHPLLIRDKKQYSSFIIRQITVLLQRLIDAERNAECRPVMIDRFRPGTELSGIVAFLRDAGAMRLDLDAAFGTLRRARGARRRAVGDA